MKALASVPFVLLALACRAAAPQRPSLPLDGPSGLEEVTIVARGLE